MKDSYDDFNFTPPYFFTIIVCVLIVHGDRDSLYSINILVEMHTAISTLSPVRHEWRPSPFIRALGSPLRSDRTSVPTRRTGKI
jgi:hypothetical protein